MQKKVYEFISKQTNDPIVEWKTCKVSGEPFAIFQSDLDFYEKISPTFDGKKFPIPVPTRCPEERQRRRLMFRNERKLYKRKCDFTGKDIVSIYSPDKAFKVYDQTIWWSDQRNPMDYGRDFDFSQTFTENFKSLNVDVPKQSLAVRESENCDYNNLCGFSKNCYMTFASSKNEDCFYAKNLSQSSDCVDILIGEKLSSCYQLIECKNCSNVYFSQNTVDCSFSRYLDNCVDCHNCFICTNLTHKSYCIHNMQYTKEEFESKVAELKKQLWGRGNATNEISTNVISESTNVYGNNIRNSSNSVFIFDSRNVEDSKYIYESYGCKTSYDQSYCDNTLGYECLGGNSYNALFSMPIGGSDLLYCMTCFDCEHCFGCIGLRNKSYCIFNKQYTQADYQKLVPQIIEHIVKTGERGEFFAPELSHFGYNETIANEYSPLIKEGACMKGFNRSDYEAPFPKADGQDVIICEISKKPFRLIPQEIAFYKKHNLLFPTKHPDVRHAERMSRKPGRELFLRKCDKCGIEMLSVYLQNSPFEVYCEKCYNKEVYG